MLGDWWEFDIKTKKGNVNMKQSYDKLENGNNNQQNKGKATFPGRSPWIQQE
jgi:hypothetical protein